MDNKEYLSEDRYQQNNAKVKKVGKIFLIIGVIILIVSFLLIVFGFIGFGNSAVNIFDTFGTYDNANDITNSISGMKDTTGSIFGNFGLFALGGIMSTIGFGLTIVGAAVMFVAHRREITAYTTQQVMPVAQEGIEKIAPTIGNAAGTIAQSIAKGIKEGTKDTNDE